MSSAIRVPFHLLRIARPGRCAAVLLRTEDLGRLWAVASVDPDAEIFAVHGGWLVAGRFDERIVEADVRLEQIRMHLLVPIGAVLVPPLTDIEQRELLGERGWVVLPHGECLEYDPAAGRSLGSFLQMPTAAPRTWRPVPPPGGPDGRLKELARVVPSLDPYDLLRAAGAGDGIGTDDPRPGKGGLLGRALGGALSRAGGFLNGLANLTGNTKLGNAAAGLLAKAMALNGQISEKLLGKQEAALQELLRKFRSGNLNDALRHAIPAGSQGDQPGSVYSGWQLRPQNTWFSLSSLLGGGGQGAGLWVGGNPETWRSIFEEYRKAARQAQDRGDYRRAAFIYGKLLADFRSAAEALSTGGLNREAAILFRDRCGDWARAAKEFEAAGEFGEALKIYRERNRYLDAGDLLMRLGEPEAALGEFTRAADELAAKHDHLAAGQLIQRKAGRADLARAYFERGWENRSLQPLGSRDALLCVSKLLELDTEKPDLERATEWFNQADDWLRQRPSVADSAHFYNGAALLPDRVEQRSWKRGIVTRCRFGLAATAEAQLTHPTALGTLVNDLFGRSGAWPAEVVADARDAVRRKIAERNRRSGARGTPAPEDPVLIARHEKPATAAVKCPYFSEMYVGFADGSVIHYDGGERRHRTVQTGEGKYRVVSLAVTETGDAVVALMRSELADDSPEEIFLLRAWRKQGSGFGIAVTNAMMFPRGSVRGLNPVIDSAKGNEQVIISSTFGPRRFRLSTLQSIDDDEVGPEAGSYHPDLHLRTAMPPFGPDQIIEFVDTQLKIGGVSHTIGWQPTRSAEYGVPLSWMGVSKHRIEVTGIAGGIVYFSSVDLTAGQSKVRTGSLFSRANFSAVCLTGPGRMAVITLENRLIGVRGPTSARKLECRNMGQLFVHPSCVRYCTALHSTQELILVTADGDLYRTPIPNVESGDTA